MVEIITFVSNKNMAETLKHLKKKPTVRTPSGTSSSELVEHAIKGIEEKKGNDTVCINLKKIANSSCDYFVICDANSNTQVQAIAASVEEYVKKETGCRPWHVEGLQNAEWVLIDYVDVVVHIFQPHIRKHFGLEDMWADAEFKEPKASVSAKKLSKAKPRKARKKTAPKVKAKKKTVKRKKSRSK